MDDTFATYTRRCDNGRGNKTWPNISRVKFIRVRESETERVGGRADRGEKERGEEEREGQRETDGSLSEEGEK